MRIIVKNISNWNIRIFMKFSRQRTILPERIILAIRRMKWATVGTTVHWNETRFSFTIMSRYISCFDVRFHWRKPIKEKTLLLMHQSRLYSQTIAPWSNRQLRRFTIALKLMKFIARIWSNFSVTLLCQIRKRLWLQINFLQT